MLADYRWFAVSTHPRAEEDANCDLLMKGYKTIYLHTYEWVAVNSRKSKLVKRPRLTGYLFVGLRPEYLGPQSLREVGAARGVHSIVHVPGGYPAPIPLEAMELVTRGSDPSGFVRELDEPEYAGQEGNVVKLGDSAGAYEGLMGEIQRIDPSGKLGILIESFGRKTLTTISPEDVDELLTPSGRAIGGVS